MDVIIVNGREVVKCPHCEGSGVCAKASEFNVPCPGQHDQGANLPGRKYRACSQCGRGLTVLADQPARPPVCLVCSGKGYHKV